MLATGSTKQYLENKHVELQKGIKRLCNGGSSATTFEAECISGVLRVQLRRVEDALARLGVGTYGLCKICGEPIAPERLAALPYATTCMNCNHCQEGKSSRH